MILFRDRVVKTLNLEQYDTKDGTPKPTRRSVFVETWGRHLTAFDWPNTERQGSQNSDDGEATAGDEHNTENIPPVIAGSQEIFLEENYRGTYAVHVTNLIAPHPQHRTRVLDNSHVSDLVDSLRSTNMGQLVIMLGLIDKDVDPESLANPGQSSVECLGGNHTRQAMQTLFEEGTLPFCTVQVRLYSQLCREMVLSLGYAHNLVSHEKRKLVSFIDKVRLMRDLLPSDPDKEAIFVWKNALALIFKKENARKLHQCFAVHLLMARLPESTWSFIVTATANMTVTERFFVDCMKLKPEFAEEAFLSLAKGEKVFKKEVKKMLADESKLKKTSKKKTGMGKILKPKEPEQNDVIVTEDHAMEESCVEAEADEDHDSLIAHLKRELAQVKPKNKRLVEENNKLKDELLVVKAENEILRREKSSLEAECANQKTKSSSSDTSACPKKMQKQEGFVEKQIVWAYYKETDTSYPAPILTVGKELIKVKWLKDDKTRELQLKYIKMIDTVKEKAIRREFKSKL